MRLYLSSFRLGTAPEHLVRLAGPGAAVGVIANAIDDEPASVRTGKVEHELEALRGLGLTPTEVDLRCFFDERDDLPSVLEAFDALWVRGGNVFVLRAALAQSGADDAVRDLLSRDALVYAGYSAGPCVLAPSLEGLERVDDATGPQLAYGVPTVMHGLGVLDRAVVPHVSSPDLPEAAGLDELVRQYAAAGVRHVALVDGQALVVDGEDEYVVGEPAGVAELLYPSERDAGGAASSPDTLT